MDLIDCPSFSVTSPGEQFRFPPTAAIIYGRSVEERSEYTAELIDADQEQTVLEIVGEDRTAFTWRRLGSETVEQVQLRSSRELTEFVSLAGDQLFLDITGLSHHVWAPIVRIAIDVVRDFRCVYVEPEDYRRHEAPTEYELFDLSERIDGIAPIPGFASLDEGREFIFAPLLGFEGMRLAYALETVQPVDQRIRPIVGVPGFRPEYPFFAYEGNQVALADSGALSSVLYAKANCPFSLYYVLDELAFLHRDLSISIALIGTKPHALGAVLFALKSRSNVELVYDYPVRKTKRTIGSARVLEYDVGTFVAWLDLV